MGNIWKVEEKTKKTKTLIDFQQFPGAMLNHKHKKGIKACSDDGDSTMEQLIVLLYWFQVKAVKEQNVVKKLLHHMARRETYNYK